MKKFAIAAAAVTFLMSAGAAFAQASGAMSNDSMSHDCDVERFHVQGRHVERPHEEGHDEARQDEKRRRNGHETRGVGRHEQLGAGRRSRLFRVPGAACAARVVPMHAAMKRRLAFKSRQKAGVRVTPGFFVACAPKVTILSHGAVGAYCIMRCAPRIRRVSAANPPEPPLDRRGVACPVWLSLLANLRTFAPPPCPPASPA